MTTRLCPANRRILVIDDTPAIHEDFRKILSAEHSPALASLEAEIFDQPQQSSRETQFELASAYQGQDGLEAVVKAQGENRPFAMAFVDVRMPPGWDGVETVSRIWQVSPDLEIVICTAHSDYSWDEITTRLGKPERLLILKKPFDVIEVMQLANTLTEKWRLSQSAKANLRSLEHVVQQRTRELQIMNDELSVLAVESQRSAERAERASRLYSVLSKISELIVRSRSSQALFEEACRILVEDGHFQTAWFGLIDRSSDSLRPLACAGFEGGDLKEFACSTDPASPFSRGPVGHALLHGAVSVCNDVSQAPELSPWLAEKRGYGSLASLPVKSGDNVLGALTLYSSEPDFFNEGERGLLERLAADLSFANQFISHELQ